MAWKAPMTAVANSILYASQWNQFVKENLKATAPGKVTAESQYFVSDQFNPNAIVARTATQHTVTTSQTTTSTSFTNLSTVGPTLTVATGKTAMVWFAARLANDTANFQAHASVQVTGASSIPPHDNYGIRLDGQSGTNQAERIMGFFFTCSLNKGNNIFTMKYRVGGGTGTFANRHLIVMPLS